MGLPLVRVGVNLFPSQAYDEALTQDVMEALRDFALPADSLELEITENIALNARTRRCCSGCTTRA